MSDDQTPKPDEENPSPLDAAAPKHGAGWRLRNYFLTGVIVAAPISITIYLTLFIINLVDDWVKPLIPAVYNPDTYLPFPVPGIGLVVAVFGLIMLGFFTANIFGRAIVGYGESLLDRMPFIRTIYRLMKQIFETVLSQTNASFREAVLVEYPRRGVWALAFVSTETRGEVATKTGYEGQMISVFLPTTPNPTSGFLLFVPKEDVIRLNMTVEEAAKLVISAGLVIPEDKLPEAIKDKVKKAKSPAKPEPQPQPQPADNS